MVKLKHSRDGETMLVFGGGLLVCDGSRIVPHILERSLHEV